MMIFCRLSRLLEAANSARYEDYDIQMRHIYSSLEACTADGVELEMPFSVYLVNQKFGQILKETLLC